MKILVLGTGFVGQRVVSYLREMGNYVTGTTTTPEKVDELLNICNEVEVVRGDEREKILDLGRENDAVIVTVGPNVQRARTPDDREEEYRSSLEITNKNVSESNPRVIFSSSLSVYGTAAQEQEPINENSRLSESREPSTFYYQQAENAVLQASQGAVIRFPDIYGAESDLSFTERIKLGHELMGGKVPFGPDAYLYRVHVEDAARAIVHVLEQKLIGVYNAVDNRSLPPRNKALFDKLADQAGLPRLEFLSQILLPDKKISAEKLLETGFEFKYTDYDFS